MLQIPASVISSVGTVSLSQAANPQPIPDVVMANPTNMGNGHAASAHYNTQQTAAQAPVRNLPKKRKFDPSQLEEIERNCSNGAPASGSLTVEYHQPHYQTSILRPSPIPPRQASPADTKPVLQYPNIDLSEWRNHRVLAKRRGSYLPGVIRQAESSKVSIEFDGPESESVEYGDIFGVNKYDIISDASPQIGHLQIGSACVVRTAEPGRECGHGAFVEAVVCEVRSAPIRILVKVTVVYHYS